MLEKLKEGGKGGRYPFWGKRGTLPFFGKRGTLPFFEKTISKNNNL
jgi:hypothetical protein